MAITPRAVGAWAVSNATTQTVTLATHVAGDMLIVRTIRKPFTNPNDTVINTAGWTAVATGVANGATANGNGLGSMGFKAFWKVATSSSETSPVVTWGTTSAPGACVAVTYQKGSSESWNTPVGDGGGDATARTSQTSTIASHISVTTGDLVDFFRGQCDDSGVLTVPTITQTSVTYDTVTEYPATAIADGTSNDIAADGGYRTATAGTSSAAAVVTGTSAASEQHGAWMTRLRVTTFTTPTGSFTANAVIKKTITPALTYVSKIGTIGSGNDQFSAPRGVASDGTHIYVVDSSNNRIFKRLASDLSYVSKIGTSGTGNDQFATPYGVATDGTYLYIADSSNHRLVKRLASDLTYVSQIGTTGSNGTGDDQFSGPVGIATDGTYVYVADTNNSRIVKRLASDLSYVSKIGTVGSGNDQFATPSGIATDGTYVYVSDTTNNRIVKRLASDLSYVSQIGTAGSGDDQFSGAYHVAAYGTHLYIADRSNYRIVKRLASDLSYLSKVGSNGSGDDQFNLPIGIGTDGTYVYVGDSSNNRIVKRLIGFTASAVIAPAPGGSLTANAVIKRTQTGSLTANAILRRTAVLDRQASDQGPASFSAAMGPNNDGAKVAQSFTAGATGHLWRLRYGIRREASPSDSAVVELWTNATDRPGSLLASVATHSNSVIGTADTFFTVDTLNVPVVSGTKYWIVWSRSGALNNTNHYRIPVYIPGTYSGGGSTFSSSAGAWSTAEDPAIDHYFVADIALKFTVDAVIKKTIYSGDHYVRTVLADGPESFWHFDETTGGTADDAVGSSNGTITGPTLGVAGLVAGGTAFDFEEGDADVVQVNGVAGLFAGALPWTIETWVAEESDGGAIFAVNGGSGGVAFIFNLGGQLNFTRAISDSILADPSPLIGGGTHYLVMTFSGTGFRAYVDGVLFDSEVETNTDAGTALTAAIGRNSNTADFPFDGVIDETAVYDFALSAGQVTSHWVAAKAATAPRLAADAVIAAAPVAPSFTVDAILRRTFAYGKSYDELVAAAGAISHWRLGESGGTTANDAIGGNDGVYGNTPTLSAPGAITGDTAVSFNGTDEDVEVPDHASLDVGDTFSVEAWFRISSGQDTFRKIVTHGSGDGWSMDLRSGNDIRASVPAIGHWAYGTTLITDTNWHYVVIAKDGSTTRKIYLDGVDDTSAVDPVTATSTTSPLFIGSNGGDEFFPGSIDEVALYSTVQTSGQVAERYFARWRVGAGLTVDAVIKRTQRFTVSYGELIAAGEPVSYWRMGEPSGTFLLDAVGSNDGDYDNTPTLGAPGLIFDSDTAVTFASASEESVTINSFTDIPIGSADRSVELWFATTTAGVDSPFLAYGGYSGTLRTFFGVLLNPSGQLVWTDSVQPLTLHTSALNDGKPHHVVLTYTGTTFRGYLDGVEANNSPGTLGAVLATNTDNFWFAYGGSYLNGTLDEIAIYDYRLVGEIAEHYAVGAFGVAGAGLTVDAVIRATVPRLGDVHATVSGEVFLNTNPNGYGPQVFVRGGSSLGYLASILPDVAGNWAPAGHFALFINRVDDGNEAGIVLATADYGAYPVPDPGPDGTFGDWLLQIEVWGDPSDVTVRARAWPIDGSAPAWTVTSDSWTIPRSASYYLSAGDLLYLTGAPTFSADAVLFKSQASSLTANAIIARSVLNDPFTRTEAVGLGVSPEGFYRTTPSNQALGTVQFAVDGSNATRPTSSSPSGTDVVSRVPSIAYGLVQIDYKTGGSEAQHSYFSYEIPAAAGPAGFTIESALGDDHIRLGANGADTSARVNVQPYDLNTWYRAKVLISGTDERSVKFWRRDVDPEPADWTTGTRTDDWYAPPAIYGDTNGDPNGLILDNLRVLSFSSDPWNVWDFFSADAVIAVGASTISGSFTANAILFRVQTGSLTANAIIKRTQTGSLTADAVKRSTVAGSFTANAVKRATISASFTVNAVLRKTISGSLTADAWKLQTISGSFTANAVELVSFPRLGDLSVSASSVHAQPFDQIISLRDNGLFSRGYFAYVTLDITNVFGFGANHAVLRLVRQDPFGSDATLATVDLGDADYVVPWQIRAEVWGDQSDVTFRARAWRSSGSSPAWTTVTDNYPGIARFNDYQFSDVTIDYVTGAPTLSADAIRFKVQTGSLTANATLRKTLTGSLTANAVIFRTASGSLTADAVKRTTLASSLTASAVVKRTATATFSADAVLFKSISGSFTAQAVKAGTFTASAWLAGRFSIDAFILAGTGGFLNAEAWIAGPYYASLSADSIILRAASNSLSASALVLKTTVTSFPGDAIKRALMNAALAADAVVRRSQSGTLGAFAVLIKSQSGTFTANSTLFSSRTGSFTGDAIKRAVANASFTSDGVILRSSSATLTANAVIRSSLTTTFTASATLFSIRSGSFSADAIVRRSLAGSLTADAVVFTAATASFTASAWIIRVISGSITADAVLLIARSGSFTAHSFVQGAGVAAFSIDATIKRIQTGSITADAVRVVSQTGSLTANAVLKATRSGSLTADAVRFRSGQAGSFSANAISLRIAQQSLTANATLRKTITATFTADAYVLAIGANFGSLTANAVLRATRTSTFTANAVIKRSQAGTFTADAFFKITVAGSFTASALARASQFGTLAGNAVLKATRASSFTASAFIQKTVAASFPALAWLVATRFDGFVAEAIKRLQQTATVTADAVLLASRSGSFTADALSRRTATGSFTVDAYREGAGVGSFTINAAFFSFTSGTISANAVLDIVRSGDLTSTLVVEKLSATVSDEHLSASLVSAHLSSLLGWSRTTLTFTAAAVIA